MSEPMESRKIFLLKERIVFVEEVTDLFVYFTYFNSISGGRCQWLRPPSGCLSVEEFAKLAVEIRDSNVENS